MLHIMATAIAAPSPDLAPYDGEPVEHFVLDMFHIAADPGDTMITAAAMNTPVNC